jgi:hypothetical protein
MLNLVVLITVFALSRIIGVLLCCKLLVVKLSERPPSDLAASSDDEQHLLLRRLIQIYELCLLYLGHTDQSVVVQALETLQQEK